MKIKELERQSGVARETIHHYLRLGLLTRPKKSARNMSYYDERHVAELALIQKLQAESYLPLDRIKEILDEGRAELAARELDLAGELFGKSAKLAPIDGARLARKTGLEPGLLERAVSRGVLQRSEGGFGWEEQRIAELLVEARTSHGLDEAVIERFEILERHVAAMVEDELAHFFGMVAAGVEPELGLELLRSGRETIGRYLAVSRARRMRAAIEEIVADVEALARQRFVVMGPLSPERRAALGEPERRASLSGAALVRHLQLQGDHEAVLERASDPHAVIEALVELGRYDELLDRASRLAPPWPPIVEISCSAAKLAKVRDALAEPASSRAAGPWALMARLRGDLLSSLMGALARLARLDLDTVADPIERLRARLLLGRVYAMTPKFLGLAPAAEHAFDAVIREARALAGSALDPGLGVLERIEWVARTARAA